MKLPIDVDLMFLSLAADEMISSIFAEYFTVNQHCDNDKLNNPAQI